MLEKLRGKAKRTDIREETLGIRSNDLIGFTFLFLTCIIWWFGVPPAFKLTGIVEAAIFSGIEACFRRHNELRFRTEFEGFVANSLLVPFFMCYYWEFFGPTVDHEGIVVDCGIEGFLKTFPVLRILAESSWSGFWRVFLFPVSLWILEVIEDYSLRLIFGTNHVWHYDDSLAILDGAVSFSYAPAWWLMGTAAVYLHPPILRFCEVTTWIAIRTFEGA